MWLLIWDSSKHKKTNDMLFRRVSHSQAMLMPSVHYIFEYTISSLQMLILGLAGYPLKRHWNESFIFHLHSFFPFCWQGIGEIRGSAQVLKFQARVFYEVMLPAFLPVNLISILDTIRIQQLHEHELYKIEKMSKICLATW